MRISGKITLDDAIVYMQLLDEEKIALVDMAHNFLVIDVATMEIIHKLHLKHAFVHKHKKSISFSPNGKYIAYSEKDQPVVRVIDVDKQKLHHSFPTHNNPIETLCFDPTSHYLVAGSSTGRVFLWNMFSSGQVSRLSSFPEYSPNMFIRPQTNYVSAIAFSPSGNLVATTGYGGSIVITDIHTEVSPKRITPNHVRINALCFIGEDILCAGNLEGSIDLIDIPSSQIIKHLQTNLTDINTLAVSSSKRFLFASAYSTHVCLIDLQKRKILDPDHITLHSKITQIQMDTKDRLFIGTESGHVSIHTLFPEEMLALRINTSAYAQAYELLHRFHLLKESPLVDELEEAFETTKEEAISLIEDNKLDEATRVIQRFANIPAKREAVLEFQPLMTHFQRFKTACEHENYALAYSMSEHAVLLKQTTPYKKLEETWDKVFLKAQTYVITDKTHQLFKILEPFSRVGSKLCFIQVLIHQSRLFLDFIQLINSHSYEKIFEIVKQYPCLKEIQSYQNIIEAADELEEKLQQHIYTSDFDLAELEIQELSHIPHKKSMLKTLSSRMKILQEIEKFHQEGALNKSYELIDKHTELKTFPLVQKIEKEWSSKIQEAEHEALLGHTTKIKKILSELITLNSRSQKIGMILRLSYLTQIKFLIVKKQIQHIERAITNYIALFGYDTELDLLIKKLAKEKILDITLSPEQEYRRPRNIWLNKTKGDVPNNILKMERV